MIPPGVAEAAGQNGKTSRSLSDQFLLLAATGLGLGYAPVAPGTFGSLAGLPLALGVQQFSLWGQIVAAGVCFIVGIPICSRGAKILGLKDPGAVVFDEIAAFPVVFAGTPLTLKTAVAGFLLFRLFDVLKPWPASGLEKLPGGLGIMADDFAAALYAAAGLWLIDWSGLFM